MVNGKSCGVRASVRVVCVCVSCRCVCVCAVSLCVTAHHASYWHVRTPDEKSSLSLTLSKNTVLGVVLN